MENIQEGYQGDNDEWYLPINNKLGMCYVCREFGIQGKEVLRLGRDFDIESGEIINQVGWIHPLCRKDGIENLLWMEHRGLSGFSGHSESEE